MGHIRQGKPAAPKPRVDHDDTSLKRADIEAHHIMSKHVVTTTPGTNVQYVAKLLDKHKIRAVPVLQGRSIVGIVSESDLIERVELGTAKGLPGSHGGRTNANLGKSYGLHAKDVMSSDVVTVRKESPLSEIVDIMQAKYVNQIPVVSKDNLLGGDKLVGIVSRSDIVHALANRPKGAGEPTLADDDIIRFKVIDTLLAMPGTSPWLSDVQVTNGRVVLSGTIQDEWKMEPSRQAVSEIDYVKEVEDRRIPVVSY